MKHFFEQHPPVFAQNTNACVEQHRKDSLSDLQCEEALLEAFSE